MKPAALSLPEPAIENHAETAKENRNLESAIESATRTRDPLLKVIVDYAWLIALIGILGASLTGSFWIYGNLWSANRYFEYLVGPGSLMVLSNLACFVAALVFKMIYKRLAEMLRKLRDVGIVRQQDIAGYVRYVTRLDRQLNSKRNLILSLCLLVLMSAYYYSLIRSSWPLLELRFLQSHGVDLGRIVAAWMRFLFIMFAGFLWAYGAGAAVWRSSVIAAAIRKLGNDFELGIQPGHPDGSGGMRSVGDLALSIALMIVVAALFLGWELMRFQRAGRTDDPNYVMAGVGLVTLVVLGAVVFIYPLLTIHDRMLAFRTRYQQELDVSFQRLRELETIEIAQQTEGRNPMVASLESAERLETLRRLYRATYDVPTWPINRSTFWKFIGLETISLLALLGIFTDILALWEYLRPSL